MVLSVSEIGRRKYLGKEELASQLELTSCHLIEQERYSYKTNLVLLPPFRKKRIAIFWLCLC